MKKFQTIIMVEDKTFTSQVETYEGKNFEMFLDNLYSTMGNLASLHIVLKDGGYLFLPKEMAQKSILIVKEVK